METDKAFGSQSVRTLDTINGCNGKWLDNKELFRISRIADDDGSTPLVFPFTMDQLNYSWKDRSKDDGCIGKKLSIMNHYESLSNERPSKKPSSIKGSSTPPLKSQQQKTMVKSSSMPVGGNSEFDLPDPFPELTNDHLLPVLAQICHPETKTASSSQTNFTRRSCYVKHPDKFSFKNTTLNVYANEHKYHQFEIDATTTVANINDQFAELEHLRRDPFWTIVEHVDKLDIERSLEDHELLYQIFKAENSPKNRFYFRKDFSRYELYFNPTQCFPERLVDVDLRKEDGLGFTTRQERYRNFLLQSLLVNQSMPDIQGFLHVRRGKKGWKKCYCILRQTGLYCITKGTNKDQNNMVLLSDLSDDNIYVALSAKKVFSAPTPYGFCLGSSYDTSDKHSLKLFCTEDDQSRLCWITGMRFVKYGSQLRDNYRASDSRNSESSEKENPECKHKSFGARSFVAEDVLRNRPQIAATSKESRTSKDQNLTMCGRDVTRSWRKTMSFQVPDSSVNKPCYTSDLGASSLNRYEWFHDRISREEAVTLIRSRGLSDGTFLIRNSQTLPGVYALSFAHCSTVKHCTIYKSESEGGLYYSLDGGSTKFMNLEHLVDFYCLNAGPLPTRLTQPVSQLTRPVSRLC